MSTKKPKELKGVIFDYGGTIDTGGRHWSSVIWEGYEKCGIAVSHGEYMVAYTETERELGREEHILPDDEFSRVLLVKLRLQLQYLSEHGLFPPAEVEAGASRVAAYCHDIARQGVEKSRPALEALSRRFPLAIVSNFYGNLDAVLREFDIAKYFKVAVDSTVAEIRKPDEALFRIAIEKLSLPAEDIAVVGDSIANDTIPAHRLGCLPVLLRPSASVSDQEAALPAEALCVTSLQELVEKV